MEPRKLKQRDAIHIIKYMIKIVHRQLFIYWVCAKIPVIPHEHFPVLNWYEEFYTE